MDNENDQFSISSSMFEDGGLIPQLYTCDGPNLNPPLIIKNVPDKAVSLVLIMYDPDISENVSQRINKPEYDHWVVYNIPPTYKVISQGVDPEGELGINDSGSFEYFGPCPTGGEHRYFFKLYALDMAMDFLLSPARKEVEEVMVGHILAETKIVGKYSRLK